MADKRPRTSSGYLPLRTEAESVRSLVAIPAPPFSGNLHEPRNSLRISLNFRAAIPLRLVSIAIILCQPSKSLPDCATVS